MAVKTITIKGTGVQKEATASGITTPGHLVQRDSAGKVKPHASAGQPVAAMFAIEDELQGNTIDDNYAVGALVQYKMFLPGDEVWAFLKDGESVAIGDKLQSGGDGTLIKYVADSALAVEYPASIVGEALEALDMSDSSLADPASNRIKIEIQ